VPDTGETEVSEQVPSKEQFALNDQSTADPMLKLRRFLLHLAGHDASPYFYADGMPRVTLNRDAAEFVKVLDANAKERADDLDRMERATEVIEQQTAALAKLRASNEPKSDEGWREAYKRTVSGPTGVLAQLENERKRRIGAEDVCFRMLATIDQVLAKAEANPISASHVSVPRELIGQLRAYRPALTKCEGCERGWEFDSEVGAHQDPSSSRSVKCTVSGVKS
jgi:hypothetical protein